MKKWIAVLLLSILGLTSCQFTKTEQMSGQASSDGTAIPAEGSPGLSASPVPTKAPAAPLNVRAKAIHKSGDILLSCTCSQLMQNDMELYDLVSLSFDARTLTIPICLKDTDVDLNMPYLHLDEVRDEVSLCMYKADFASKYGLGTGSYFTLSLSEKGGYQDAYFAHQYTRSEHRQDYTSDAVFANYRMVQTSGIRRHILYRSSNPLGHKVYTARPPYADRLIKKAHIATVLNLANNGEQIKELLDSPAFNSPFYQSLLQKNRVFYCHASTDLTSEEFTESLILALKYIVGNDGPYLIHCNEGKDRTGVACALLECLCGASLSEVTHDYMLSFENFYGIERESRSWQILAEGNILTTLSRLFIDKEDPGRHIKELETLDLENAASSYLLENGLTSHEIHQIRESIGY